METNSNSKWPFLIMSVVAVIVFVVSGVLNQLWAEPSSDYYAKAVNKSGAALKDALHEIIDGHKQLPYTNPKNKNWFDDKHRDVWEALAYTDSACSDEFRHCGKVSLLYLDETRDLAQAHNKGGPWGCQDFWQREHVWPTSRGDFKGDRYAGYTDLHHIRPADSEINNKRGNYGYNSGGIELVYDKSEHCPNRTLSARLDSNKESFDPPIRAKGQVARMLFYMDVRYDSSSKRMPDLSLKAENVKYDSKKKKPWIGHLCKLLEWNRRYPPTEFEIRRNERVEQLQGNRNPFIDNPAWADDIWLSLFEEDCP